jgi:hypothetical protein
MKLRICVLGTEVEPISTYVDFGEREFLVADQRGYDYLLYKMAEDFLYTSSEGKILDSRLKLNKVDQSHSFTIFLFLLLSVVLFFVRFASYEKNPKSSFGFCMPLSICCRDPLTHFWNLQIMTFFGKLFFLLLLFSIKKIKNTFLGSGVNSFFCFLLF